MATSCPWGCKTRSAEIEARSDATLRALAYPTGFLRDRFDFLNEDNEWRRLFAELLGTFSLFVLLGRVLGSLARRH